MSGFDPKPTSRAHGHTRPWTHKLRFSGTLGGASPMAEAQVERRLAAILAGDVAGYSRSAMCCGSAVRNDRA